MKTQPSTAAIARLGAAIEKIGTHGAAWYVLRGSCIRLTGGSLSLSDLPDLPCLMNAGDEIDELFKAEGACEHSLSLARELADDAVRELLEEEGFPVKA